MDDINALIARVRIASRASYSSAAADTDLEGSAAALVKAAFGHFTLGCYWGGEFCEYKRETDAAVEKIAAIIARLTRERDEARTGWAGTSKTLAGVVADFSEETRKNAALRTEVEAERERIVNVIAGLLFPDDAKTIEVIDAIRAKGVEWSGYEPPADEKARDALHLAIGFKETVGPDAAYAAIAAALRDAVKANRAACSKIAREWPLANGYPSDHCHLGYKIADAIDDGWEAP